MGADICSAGPVAFRAGRRKQNSEFMSYESNDERIERLENQVAELIKIQKGTLGLSQDQGEVNFCVVSLIVLFKNESIALLRFLASSSLIENENERLQLLRGVSRLESDCEKVEAMVARLGKVIKNPEPEAPPSDDPSSPGAAT
jgi:hypothetical protein